MEQVFDFETSDFTEVVKTSGFVDKSMLIKKVFEQRRRFVVTAPPCFGKSTNLDMIKRFVEIQVDEKGEQILPVQNTSNYKMFKYYNLAVTKDEEMMKEFGKYPTMYVNCKYEDDIKCFDSFVNYCRKVVHECFKKHRYLIFNETFSAQKKKTIKIWCDENHYKTTSAKDTQRGLKNLASYLNAHFLNKKFAVIVLVDDYDFPMKKAMCNLNEKELHACKYYYFDVFSHLFLFNYDIRMGMLTGVFRVHICNDYFQIRHYFEYLLDEKFTPFYGSTLEETNILLNKFNVPDSLKSEVREMYGGFRSRNDTYQMYNLSSVLKFLKEYGLYRGDDFKLQCYCKQFKNMQMFNVIIDDDLYVNIEMLINDKSIDLEMTGLPDDFFPWESALKNTRVSTDDLPHFTHLGYLTFTGEVQENEESEESEKSEESEEECDFYLEYGCWTTSDTKTKKKNKREQDECCNHCEKINISASYVKKNLKGSSLAYSSGDEEYFSDDYEYTMFEKESAIIGRSYKYKIPNKECKADIKQFLYSCYLKEYGVSENNIVKCADIMNHFGPCMPISVYENFRTAVEELLNARSGTTFQNSPPGAALCPVLCVLEGRFGTVGNFCGTENLDIDFTGVIFYVEEDEFNVRMKITCNMSSESSLQQTSSLKIFMEDDWESERKEFPDGHTLSIGLNVEYTEDKVRVSLGYINCKNKDFDVNNACYL